MQRYAVLAALLAAMLLPLLVSDYRTFQFTQALIYAIALMGLNLLMGYNGQVSLGHGAFYAIGAYTAAIVMNNAGLPYYLAVPVAGAVCFLAGFLFGLPAVKLQGLYLALATLALALALPQLLRFDPLEPWTGGVMGTFVDKPPVPFALPMSQDQWLYWFTLGVLVLLLAAARNLSRGRIGRALVAIRDHPIAAESMGIDSTRFKALTFGVSALYTGVAGALMAIVVNFVAPDGFDLLLSITLFVGVVVGGLASISGAIYGGLFIVFVPNLAQQVSDAAPWMIYGILIVVLIYVMPLGIAGFLNRLWLRWNGDSTVRRRREPRSHAKPTSTQRMRTWWRALWS